MTDIKDLITDNIDLWTSAIKKRNSQGRGASKKIELTGVKKLREFILELAVSGKLVPQDPSDEPASVLLEKLVKEKEQLITDKKIKKQKPLPPITDEEQPFELPHGWTWTRLGDSGDTNVGLTYSPKDAGDIGTPVLRSTNVQKGKIDLNELVRVDMKVKESAYVHEGDLLICARNGSKALVGKTASIPSLSEPMAFGAFMAIYRSPFNKYFEKFINSPVFRRNLTGVDTTTINQITQGNLRSTIAPVPPLAEQHRIVAKVDELMALCDQLEQQTEQSLSAHQSLVEVLLAALMPSTSKSAEGSSDSAVPVQESFQTSWQRISDHFDVLFTTEQSIEKLKQTILQLAVMGKLVPQNPSDEPASVLLEKIAEEKAQLIADKVISKAKKIIEITDEEKSFHTPNSWGWLRLDSLFNIIVDCPHSTAKFQDTGLLCIDTNSFKQGILHQHKFRYVSQETFDKRNARLIPRPKDIIFAREGSVGESVVIPDGVESCLGQRVMLFRPSIALNSEFLRLTISNKGALNKLLSMHKGIGAKHVNVRDMRAFPICLPPEKEQHRIVAKVDELMALCEQLKARLVDAQTTQLHLADAVVENALSAHASDP